MFAIFISISLMVVVSDGLKCQQCGIHLTSNVNAKNTEKCLDGFTEEKLCTSPNHTHCIVNFYRDIYVNTILILWRKCGTKDDIMPCAVFDVNRKGNSENASAYIGSLISKGKDKFTRLKQESAHMDQWKPLETPVKPRPGLIQVCSVESNDCNSSRCVVEGENVLRPVAANTGSSLNLQLTANTCSSLNFTTYSLSILINLLIMELLLCRQ